MDTASPSAILKVVLPNVPRVLRGAFWYTLGYSPTSKKWDLKTEIIVTFIRSMLDSPKPSPISKQQYQSMKDPGIKGPMWISKVTIPPPEENDVRAVLVDAIEALKEGGESYTLPEIQPVEAEWTGYRSNVDSNRARPDLSEEQHYEKMMEGVTSDVTTLYFHGGAYYLCDPCTHRLACSKLARLTGGRCLNVRYRLAPQHPFPSQLLDALMAYLYLLSPPPGSFHKPIPAKHIVFAGDSAGGNLSMALLQLLLQIHRSSPSKTPTIRYHGREVDVPLPAGVAPISGWMDITRCMPSITSNAQYDYLPPPPSKDFMKHFPKCPLWPTDPPRGDIYCETSMLCHPLVSPMAAKDWRGTCPVYLVYGTEQLLDEGKVVAQRIAQQGGKIIWEEYDAMPHVFCMLLEHVKSSKICLDSLTQFMKDAVAGKPIETKGTFFEAKTYNGIKVDVTKLDAFSEADVDSRMREARIKRDHGEEGETKLLPRL